MTATSLTNVSRTTVISKTQQNQTQQHHMSKLSMMNPMMTPMMISNRKETMKTSLSSIHLSRHHSSLPQSLLMTDHQPTVDRQPPRPYINRVLEKLHKSKWILKMTSIFAMF